MTAYDWLTWRVTKGAEDAQRRHLGLPQATSPSPRRIGQRNSLEIQAYDAACFRGWPKSGRNTEADGLSWVLSPWS